MTAQIKESSSSISIKKTMQPATCRSKSANVHMNSMSNVEDRMATTWMIGCNQNRR